MCLAVLSATGNVVLIQLLTAACPKMPVQHGVSCCAAGQWHKAQPGTRHLRDEGAAAHKVGVVMQCMHVSPELDGAAQDESSDGQACAAGAALFGTHCLACGS